MNGVAEGRRSGEAVEEVGVGGLVEFWYSGWGERGGARGIDGLEDQDGEWLWEGLWEGDLCFLGMGWKNGDLVGFMERWDEELGLGSRKVDGWLIL